MHETFMERCLTLARGGAGRVSPNPMVGCVLVQNNLIVSEGWHRAFGGKHAEPDALAALPPGIDPKTLTLYVNLEPCNHHGKTPPCADTIITAGIRKVVIGAEDPNPLVAGKGIQKLKEAGVDVTVGVLTPACMALNKVFYVNQIFKRPYIYIKWAETTDRKIGALPFDVHRKRISGKHSQIYAHRLRAASDAILCGGQTIRDDDPALTTRLWPGKNPDIYIYAPSGNLPVSAKVFHSDRQTVVVTNPTEPHHFQTIGYDAHMDHASAILQAMQRHDPNLTSILLEGGRMLHQAFLDAGLYDEIICIKSKTKFMGPGVSAPESPVLLKLTEENEEDLIYTYRRYE